MPNTPSTETAPQSPDPSPDPSPAATGADRAGLSSRSRWALALLFVIAVTAVVFAPALQGGFIWDDQSLVVNNCYIKHAHYLSRNLTSSFWDVCGSEEPAELLANAYFRPIVTLSYMVDYQLWGLDARGYHLTSLLLHLVAVALAYLFVYRLMPQRPLAALFASLMFSLHPTRAESVAWISGRTDLMAAVFILLTLHLS
jgi:hypothetical protein